MFDEDAVALIMYDDSGKEERISLLTSKIDVHDILSVKSMFCMKIDGKPVYFEQLSDYVNVLQQLKLKVKLQKFCEIMGYEQPKTQEQIFALDIIPSDLLQRAQQVHQRKEIPDFKVRLPTDNTEEDNENQQDMSDKDNDLVAKFLATR